MLMNLQYGTSSINRARGGEVTGLNQDVSRYIISFVIWDPISLSRVHDIDGNIQYPFVPGSAVSLRKVPSGRYLTSEPEVVFRIHLKILFPSLPCTFCHLPISVRYSKLGTRNILLLPSDFSKPCLSLLSFVITFN